MTRGRCSKYHKSGLGYSQLVKAFDNIKFVYHIEQKVINMCNWIVK